MKMSLTLMVVGVGALTAAVGNLIELRAGTRPGGDYSRDCGTVAHWSWSSTAQSKWSIRGPAAAHLAR